MRQIFILSIVLFLAGFSTAAPALKSSSYKVAKAGVGIDSIKIGRSTRSDIIRKYGRRFKTVKHYDKGKFYSVQMKYRSGMSFYYCARDKKQEVFDIELRAPLKVKTARGIVLGKSNTNQLIRKYGQPVKLNSLRFKGIEFYYSKIKGKKIVTVIDIVEKSGMRQCRV